MSNSSTEFMTNSYGERCNDFYNGPLFMYNGTVVDETADFYYMVTNDTTTATTDSITAFKNLFNANGTMKDLLAINNLIGVGKLTSFTLSPSTGFKEYSDLYSESLSTPLNVTITPATMTSPNSISITITSGTAYQGSVYIGVDLTGSSITPTQDALMSCKLSSTSNISLSNCNRVIVPPASLDKTVTIPLTVDGLKNTTSYRVFTMPTNRFPYRPLPLATVTLTSVTNTGVNGTINFTNNNPIV